MNRTQTIVATTLSGLFATTASFAVPPQLQPLCGFRQPWTPPAAAHRSIVDSCQNPVPADRVALDDFVVPCSGDARRLRWWGVLLDPQQAAGRSYYIAVYSDVNCAPDMLLYEACVVPQAQAVAMDCTNRNVFVFSTPIPPLAVTAGTRYWLQISEDDQDSANVGQDDFRWSGRQPVRGCPAVQMDAEGDVFGPLHDACNDAIDDLSFVLSVFQTPGGGAAGD